MIRCLFNYHSVYETDKMTNHLLLERSQWRLDTSSLIQNQNLPSHICKLFGLSKRYLHGLVTRTCFVHILIQDIVVVPIRQRKFGTSNKTVSSHRSNSV